MKFFKSKITAMIAVLAVGFGVGFMTTSSASAAVSMYGTTIDAKEPTQWGATQAMVGMSIAGTVSGSSHYVQKQLIRYNGSGWVAQGDTIQYAFYLGQTYNGSTSNHTRSLHPGAWTYVVRVRYLNSNFVPMTGWDNSAGKTLLG